MVKQTPLKLFIVSYVANITQLEIGLMHKALHLRDIRLLSCFLKIASRLGDWPIWVVTSLCLLVLGDGQSHLAVLAAALAVAMSIMVFMSVKNLVGRPRPCEAGGGVSPMMAAPDKFSFPSGHTMTAFAVWGAFSVGLPFLSPAYLATAMIIGLSRVYLGLHYPTDVLVGAFLGGVIGVNVAGWII